MKKEIAGILTVLMFFAAAGFCLADDTTDQLKAQNQDLKNKNTQLTQQVNYLINNTQGIINKFNQLRALTLDFQNKNTQLTAQFNDVFNDRQALLNKLNKISRENADLKLQLDLLQQSKGHQQKIPDDLKLKQQLVEAMLKLMATKNKDENLKQEVANMHYNLGTALQNQNKYDEAINEFESDLRYDPQDTDAHYNLALIYDKVKNNRKAAIVHYNMYLKLDPDAADALKIKERLTALDSEQRVWGNPNVQNIDEKQGLGRF